MKTALLAVVAASFALPATAAPLKLIYDTDMSLDIDDAGALAMIHNMADRGEVELLACVTSDNDEWAAPATDAVNTFYGRPDIPIGALHTFGNDSKFTKPITDEFPNDLKTSKNAPPAVRMYRELLAGLPDKSVVIVTVGLATNIANLLKSGPDEISPLDGKELIARKVIRYASGGNGMCGLNAERTSGGKAGWNYLQDLESARYELEHFPSDRTPFLEAGCPGNKVITMCDRLMKETPPTHILHRMRVLYGKCRESWDETRLLQAVYGDMGAMATKGPGSIALTGQTLNWSATPNRNHTYYWSTDDAKLTKVIDDMMLFTPAPPDRTPPRKPTAAKVRSRGDGSAELTWTASDDPDKGSWVVGYDVYRDSQLLGRAHRTLFVATGETGTKHRYQVAAVNSAGLRSAQVLARRTAGVAKK